MLLGMSVQIAVRLPEEDLQRPLARRASCRRRATRGDVHDVDWPGLGSRPAVIVTRPTAIPT
jgi:hypothetical protein